MNFEEIKQKINTFCEKDKDILFAYVFGSQVINRTDSESDIDIAIFLDEKVEDRFEKRLKLMGAFERIFNKRADVVILNDIKSIFFKFVIIKEGKLVFEKDPDKRADFEVIKKIFNGMLG